MTILLLVACIVDPRSKGIPDPIGEFEGGSVSLSPAAHDFGAVAVGAAVEPLVVTVSNVGEGTLTIGAVTVEGDAGSFAVTAPAAGFLAPGEQTEMVVAFTPEGNGPVSARVGLETDDEAQPVAWVDVSGEGIAGGLLVVPAETDLGTVEIGCEGVRTVQILNTGDGPLGVSEVDLASWSAEFSLDLQASVNGALPWALGAGESREIKVYYRPLDEVADESTLRVTATDPVQPHAEGTLRGLGEAWQDGSDRFYQTGGEKVDVVLHPSAIYTTDEKILGFADAVMDALDADRRSWRFAVPGAEGCVESDDIFIDDATSASRREDLLGEMVDALGGGTYYLTFDAVLAFGDDGRLDAGGCNEGLLRDDATLLVVVTTPTDEYSRTSPDDFVDDLSSYPSIPELTRLEVVGPDGSGSSYCYAEAREWSQAATDLGGALYSYCADDWTPYLQEMLAHLPEAVDHVTLSQTPVEATLSVTVDDAAVEDGWYYVAAENTLYFEFDAVPAAGSEVVVRYAVVGTCD